MKMKSMELPLKPDLGQLHHEKLIQLVNNLFAKLQADNCAIMDESAKLEGRILAAISSAMEALSSAVNDSLMKQRPTQAAPVYIFSIERDDDGLISRAICRPEQVGKHGQLN